MPPMTQFHAYPGGGYHVQYTDDALAQANNLGEELRNRLHGHLEMVASVNPYLHGAHDTLYGTDRRNLDFENLIVTVWVSGTVRVLTVVNIRTGDVRQEEEPKAEPFVPLASSRPRVSPFAGFADMDDDEAEEIPVARVSTAG